MPALIAYQLFVGLFGVVRALGLFALLLVPEVPMFPLAWIGLGMLAGPVLLVCSSIALARSWRGRRIAAVIGIIGSVSTWAMSTLWFDAARQFAKSQGKGLPVFLRILHVVMAVSLVAACILYRSLADPTTAREAVPRPR